MKRILVFVTIICMAFLIAGAQEVVEEPVIPEPTPEPISIASRLDVTLIDDIGGHKIKLENAIVQMAGELHVAGDLITYSDIFTDGDLYEMIIWIRTKK